MSEITLSDENLHEKVIQFYHYLYEKQPDTLEGVCVSTQIRLRFLDIFFGYDTITQVSLIESEKKH
jgi:hypothetical protein